MGLRLCSWGLTVVLASVGSVAKAQYVDCSKVYEVGSQEWAQCTVEQIEKEEVLIGRFKFFNECWPVSVHVATMGEHEKELLISEDIVRDLLETRLREARLYSSLPAPVPLLEVNIMALDAAYSVELSYIKFMDDEASGHSYHATTWDTGMIGEHPELTSGIILDALSALTDDFLDRFLEVNDPLCEKYDFPDWINRDGRDD